MTYKLLKDYETPTMKIYAGCQKTIPEWCKVFPDMLGKDFEIKKDWFEFVQIEKPPLGLMPEFIWIEKRIYEIDAAIKRYSAAKKAIPINWIAEYGKLKSELAGKHIDLNIWSEAMKEKDVICSPMKVIVNGIEYIKP